MFVAVYLRNHNYLCQQLSPLYCKNFEDELMDFLKMKPKAKTQIEEFLYQDFLNGKSRGENAKESDFVYICETDAETDAMFLVHSLLNLYLKHDSNVCFLSLSQSFNHYSVVSQKLGVDLKAMKDAKRLLFIEGLKLMGESIIGNPVKERANDNNTDFEHVINKNSLCELSHTLNSHIEELTSDGKSVTVIIDNITVLLSIGVPVACILTFCHNLIGHTRDRNIDSLIILSNFDGEEEFETMMKFLQHLCSVSIIISSLTSGYCKDVHGKMKVCRKRRLGRKNTVEKTVQFKINDKNICLFALGLSSAVL